MTIPYVYLIGWTKIDKWYIGCRYAQDCHPSDLWKTYFTSSEYVTEFRKENGEPDSFKIMKECVNSEEALAFEEQKQREYDILNNDKFLNRNISGKFFAHYSPHSEESKRKMSEIKLGKKRKPFSEEHKRKISKSQIGLQAGNKNPMFGKPGTMLGRKHSEKSKQKMSEIQKGKKHSKETRKKMKESAKNRPPVSEETRKKLSNVRKGKKDSNETIAKRIATRKANLLLK